MKHEPITGERMTGRKRKGGKREPNGRHKRDPKAETEWLAMEHVLRRRCRELGWWNPEKRKNPSVEDMRRARDQNAGTPWGQLYLREIITRQQCETMTAFANLRHDWLQSIAAPSQHGSDMNPDNRGQSLSAENVARVRAIRAAYLAADRALRAAGVQPARAVFLVLEGETPNIEMLRLGLDALRKSC